MRFIVVSFELEVHDDWFESRGQHLSTKEGRDEIVTFMDLQIGSEERLVKSSITMELRDGN